MAQNADKAADRSMARRDFLPSRRAASYDFISPLSLNLHGNNVLITGSALPDGVGFATARAFARAGASGIVLADLHPVPSELVAQLKAAAVDAKRSEPTVITRQVDISKLEDVQVFAHEITAQLAGRLDVLVNNAAHQEPYGTLLDSDPDVYWRTWKVNVHGLFNMARAFLPMLLSTRAEQGGLGTMINVSSSGALSVRLRGAGYRSSKLAVLRWTEALQVDHEQDGLHAYCINPGAIKTQLTVNEPEELRNKLPHKPELPGDTIAWLAAERKEWLGGRYISCPWDMEELVARKDEIIKEDKLKLRLSL